MSVTDLVVRSHVSRDLLQAAGMFKNERLAVWEYVSNSLQYVDPGAAPVVNVRLDTKRKRITIEDNGRGMDWKGLENFFVLHGENVDRKAGRPGRGRYGTGKSAAFGIGDVLRITTVQAGRRSKVELRRGDLDAATSGAPVPVRSLERMVSTGQPNGTLVEIEQVRLPRALDQAGVTHYIERHLAHWPRNSTVLVNNRPCEVNEPPIERTVNVPSHGDVAKILGSVTLTLKVSKSPLEEDLRGISIYADGVWHETTLLSSTGKEMSDYIFGEIDVPILDSDTSTPPAFDASRSLHLNPDNRIVSEIYGFVAPEIERVRKELVEAQRKVRETEEAKRLEREASQIEKIINEDFRSFRSRLQKVKAAANSMGIDVGEASSAGAQAAGEDDFLYGGEVPATIVSETGEVGGGGGTEVIIDHVEPRRLNPIVEPDPAGESTGHYERRGDQKPRSTGGFKVEFDNQGPASTRATYVSEKRTIYINLDHPQIATAKANKSAEDVVFRRLAYEVAFSEYAVAVASELNNRGEFLEPSDAIVEIRDRLNAVARQAAALYAA